MRQAGTILSKLDRDTRLHHFEADAGWVFLRNDATATREDYVRELVMTYGFEAPYEEVCACTPGLGQRIDLRGRFRSKLIMQDLMSLGWPHSDIGTIMRAVIPPFSDPAEALAWMYVVERATLIHAEVRDSHANRFVDIAPYTTNQLAYRRHASARWAEMGIALDRAAISDVAEERILQAANDAFRALRTWRRGTTALQIVG